MTEKCLVCGEEIPIGFQHECGEAKMKLSERMLDQTHGANHHQKDDWAREVAKLEAEIAALKRGVESAHLHLLASICECGEPLKETDAFDVLDALLTKEEEDE